ncbi:MAG: EI24 domain-containing protein [Bacteroidales bacterium]|nr:EI24 domain-containing protein [Bacteroidales bacterium]
MIFRKQVAIGFKGYFKAIELLFSKGFIKYMIFPLLLNVLFFWLGISFVKDAADWASDAFVNWINIGEGNFWGAGALKWLSSGLIEIIIYSLFFITFVYFGGFVIIIILSPLFSIISEKTEYVLSEGGIDYPFELKQFIIDVFRGIGIAIRNVLLETGIMILIFIAGIILSFISWLGVIFMFFVSSYFYGFSYMDYTNERHKRKLKDSVKHIRKYKWVAIVNGSLFAFVLFIPWLGTALSAFIAVISVIAGTVSMLEIKKIEDIEIDKMFNAEI